MKTILRRSGFVLLGLALAAGLSACMSLNLGTAMQMRSLDYLNDDISSLVIAVELPEEIQAKPEGSVLNIDVTSANLGERQVVAQLRRADADQVAASLPSPSPGRSYYVFAVPDDGRAEIRSLQAEIRELKQAGEQGDQGTIALSVSPAFCAAAPFDPNRESYSVYVALPGGNAMQPLITGQRLSEALQAPGAVITACD